jgi:glyoxylase I family protein
LAGGVDHLDLVVSDLERSLAFYQELLRPLGYSRLSEVEGERGERVLYIGRDGGYALSLRERQSPRVDEPYDRYDLGLHHIAFRAESRDQVEERADWLRAQNVEIESGPKEHDYSEGYYAVFFYDPDGLKLEIVHRPGFGPVS